MSKRESFTFVDPISGEQPSVGQACMRSVRMQADLLTIAAHRLTAAQQEKLRAIAKQLKEKGIVDTKLFESFVAGSKVAKPPRAGAPKTARAKTAKKKAT